MSHSNSAWIISARFDGCFILAPAIIISLIVLIFSRQIALLDEFPPWLWLTLIVGIDAGHVYTTLFRTYLVKKEWQQRQGLLTLIPLTAWLVGCLLYSINSMAFWRVLAYLAIFHFVRQQYGFMMIYGRNERDLPDYFRNLDKAAIYLATLYPLIYWHCRGREFNWFIAEDIISLHMPDMSNIVGWLYLAVLAAYVIKEGFLWVKTKSVNFPRNLMLLGTALSWYVGIVAFNNDLIFSATNVIGHGMPYYALIWAYGYKQAMVQKENKIFIYSSLNKLFRPTMVALFILLMLTLAYLEEGIWDGLIWHEHWQVFGLFNLIPQINSPQILTWLIPLLALPQTTHYLLDAYIWRLQTNSDWKHILFYKDAPNVLTNQCSNPQG